MNVKSFGLTLAAGLAAFLIVGVAVTELLQSRIEFSLLVGLPAGLLAGAITIAAVALSLGDRVAPKRRKVAYSAGVFAVAFLVVLVTGAILSQGITIAIIAGIVLGLGAAVVTYLRVSRDAESPTTASSWK